MVITGKYSWVIVFLVLFAGQVCAQQSVQSFIYGKVTTVSGDVYQGLIRWGHEEVFWSDVFDATKLDQQNLRYQYSEKESDKPKDTWLEFDWNLLSIWEDEYSQTTHVFSCMFGDLKALERYSPSHVELVLKNGASVRLGNCSSDLGVDLHLIDDEIGDVRLRWERVRSVKFEATPPNLKETYGEPLYGTVETETKGDFTGYIQWGDRSRLTTDVLKGQGEIGSIRMAFGKIKSITKADIGSILELKSGRKLHLLRNSETTCSEEVIAVHTPSIGKVDVYWSQFRKLRFEELGKNLTRYEDFKSPLAIKGTVKIIDGKSLTGLIAYDIDEAWEFEMLHGCDDGIKYAIPFRNIRSVQPKNYNYSYVELRNGKRLLLGYEQDVSEDNEGLLLVTRRQKKPIYVPWKTIDEITFKAR